MFVLFLLVLKFCVVVIVMGVVFFLSLIIIWVWLVCVGLGRKCSMWLNWKFMWCVVK